MVEHHATTRTTSSPRIILFYLTSSIFAAVVQTSYVCQLVTFTANGPRKLEIVSTSKSVRVENVRFVISGGAQFSLSLGGDDQDGEAIFVGTAELVSEGESSVDDTTITNKQQ